MRSTLYEKPMKIELIDNVLFIDGEQHRRDIRTLAQMRPVLKEDVPGDRDIYYMYRDVYGKNGIRYDITVILPEPIGKECAKTFGHYHPESGSGKSYPEIYQVLRGSALFLLQKRNDDGSVDVIMVDANEGETVLMPPDYGHISINNGDKPLVLANLVYEGFSSEYGEVRGNHGGAYYYTTEHDFIQNTNYMVNRNSRLSARELNSMHNIESEDLLQEFFENPEKFDYLKKPELL